MPVANSGSYCKRGEIVFLTNFAIFNFLTAESETNPKPAHNIAAHRYAQAE